MVTSFQLSVWRALRARLSTGFSGCEPLVTPQDARPLSFTVWSSLVHVGLFKLTMVASVRLPTHRHLLAGMTRVNFERTRISSRFTD